MFDDGFSSGRGNRGRTGLSAPVTSTRRKRVEGAQLGN
jgi:hypothetical protein